MTGTLEARLYRGRFDDGLLDVFVGVGVLAIGLSWLADLVAIGGFFPAMLPVMWGPVRRRVVEPHAGYVKFSPPREATERRRTLGLVAAGVGALAVFVALGAVVSGGELGTVARWLLPGLPAFLLGVAGALAAVVIDVRRLALYGAVLVLCGLGVAAVDGHPGLAMTVGGLVVLAVGAARLATFLRHAEAT